MDTAVLQTYLHIVDEGSFAAAARRMGISKSLCSKYISDLEDSLGTRLLTRSTRSVRPTPVGREYYQKIRDVMGQLQAANESVKRLSAHPSGPLRIGSPVSYTLKVLGPHIMRFIEAHPDIQLEAVLDDRHSDVISEGFDAVIRIGELGDSSLYARRLHSARILVVASPDYLTEHGTPERPEDLLAHRCLHYSNLRGAGTWPFRDGSETLYQKIQPAFSTNSAEMMRAAVLEGRGVALLPEFMIEEELRSGTLVPVLARFALPDLPVNLVYPSRKNMTAALKAFLDFTAGLKLEA